MDFPKYKICVSGAAETAHCGDEAYGRAVLLGKEIVTQGAVFVDGATTGFPYWASKGAKEAGGTVVGVSPASSRAEHVTRYRLPVDYHDIIMYTGHGYSGRNLLLTRMADAIIVGCGRMGTMNEFTIAFEDRKPIGILEGNWEMDELVKEVILKSHRAEEMSGRIFFSNDPRELVSKILKLIAEDEANQMLN